MIRRLTFFLAAVLTLSATVCGLSCSSSEVCTGGVCTCSGSYNDPVFMCDGVCVHVGFDPNNCGGCGQVCDSPLFCSNGQCSPTCLLLGKEDVPTCQPQPHDAPLLCPPTYAACSEPFALCQCETGTPHACGCR